ncbi:MAG TPA: FAD-dependent oxidoreductase [Planctomycetes bacterium]|nr:FAD-dependent oxidoreductase [Planctomycetota bacterium]
MRYYEDGHAYDLVVAGGGLSGVAAAAAASRLGVDVLLIEHMQFLGGMATAGLVNPWMPYRLRERDGASEEIIQGIFKDINRRLTALGGLKDPVFHPHLLKMVLNDLADSHNFALLCGVIVTGARVRKGRIGAVEVAGKSWKRVIKGRFFIDATGDADLAASAGFPTDYGREEDGAVQPSTLNFRVCGVDMEKFNAWRPGAKGPKGLASDIIDRWRAEGRLHCPRQNLLIFNTTWSGVLHFNQTRLLGVDPRDPVTLTKGYSDALRFIGEYLELLRSEVPGFENADLQEIAPCPGIRESRRIVAEYMLTEDDVLSARKFDDGVVRANYPVDIHNPTGGGTVIKRVPEGDNYEIPYRSLIPRNSVNLLVAGRPIGSTHVAHASLRVMPICTGIGEAAGTAAALLLRGKKRPAELDTERLRSTLVENGQNLNRPGT